MIFNALEKKKVSKKLGKNNAKNEWQVVLTTKNSSDPPIELNGDIYELNKNNPELDTVLKMMGLLRDE